MLIPKRKRLTFANSSLFSFSPRESYKATYLGTRWFVLHEITLASSCCLEASLAPVGRVRKSKTWSMAPRTAVMMEAEGSPCPGQACCREIAALGSLGEPVSLYPRYRARRLLFLLYLDDALKRSLPRLSSSAHSELPRLDRSSQARSLSRTSNHACHCPWNF